MLRVDGKKGFITYDDATSTYLRVWYADWQWNLGGTFMWSLDADYDGQTQDLLDAMYAASLSPEIETCEDSPRLARKVPPAQPREQSRSPLRGDSHECKSFKVTE